MSLVPVLPLLQHLVPQLLLLPLLPHVGGRGILMAMRRSDSKAISPSLHVLSYFSAHAA